MQAEEIITSNKSLFKNKYLENCVKGVKNVIKYGWVSIKNGVLKIKEFINSRQIEPLSQESSTSESSSDTSEESYELEEFLISDIGDSDSEVIIYNMTVLHS